MTEPLDERWLAETRNSYDTVADNYAAQLRDELSGRPVERAMLDLFAELVDGQVADVGCGPGRVSGYLAERGVDVFGIDLSPAMVDVARRDYPDLRFEVGSMLDLALADGSLGGVLAWYSIIHVPPAALSQVFAGFRRALAPGGQMLLGFQVGDERRRITSGYGHEVALDAYRLRPAQIAGLLGEAGFDIHTTTVREPDTGERTQQAFLLAAAR